MISEIKKHTQETSLVFVLGKKNYLSEEENSNIYEFASNFINGNEDFDYIKNGDKFTFFVKESDSKEKLRVAGHKVRTHLNKSATEITIVSKKEYSLVVAEGLALSNYQFLKYFKDATKKKYALEKINVVGKFDSNEINKLNNTIKAVLWARDMVNEPVSFLTATQLATEIKKLGEEADFSVNVLEKNQIESLKMGGLLAVNKGSIEPPTFSILEYKFRFCGSNWFTRLRLRRCTSFNHNSSSFELWQDTGTSASSAGEKQINRFPRRVRIHGGEFGESARAIHRIG
jgi:leucyl aminopeptidase